MNKETYLQDLRKALKILPQYDRDEAVEFYEEYFDEAGVENEAKVIEELGEPKALAKKILVDVVDKKYEQITGNQSSIKALNNTENTITEIETIPNPGSQVTPVVPVAGYETGAAQPQMDQGFQQAPVQPQAKEEREEEKTSSLKTLWIVLAAIFALPLSPFVFALFIVVCVLIMVLYIVLVTFIITTVSFIFIGAVTAIVGVAVLFLNPIVGMCVLGTGLALFGLGIFGTIGTIALFRVTSRGLSHLFGRIVHKKNRKNKAKLATA